VSPKPRTGYRAATFSRAVKATAKAVKKAAKPAKKKGK
jgi:hypothetical protein